MADVSVRPARVDEAGALGALQARTWRAGYAGLLPPDVLDGLDPGALGEAWRAAVATPPSPRHRVLVAEEAGTAVGFVAVTPAGDPDLDPSSEAELGLLVVAPEARKRGHASRLLAAVVDELRTGGSAYAYIWCDARDGQLLAFLTGAGWAEDGARRSLDLRGDGAVLVEQVRLHTDLRPVPS